MPAAIKVKSNQKVDFPQLEEQVLEYWDNTNVFKASINNRPKDKSYVFYDGPPFATGLPHYGHLLASTIKDVIPRYWTMKGYRVERKWGWDCHGLPIENIIEKELDLNDKKDIEAFGIEEFNNACRSTVLRYRSDWKQIIRRLGRWADMEDDYKTMDSWYMESLWWVFKALWQRGLIYQGHKSMHVCPRCSTPLSNFEVTQGYKDVKDISVYVEFKLDAPEIFGDSKNTYMLAWTTTPWTLPGNVMLALNPNTEYVLFKSQEPNNQYIIAKNPIDTVLVDDPYEIIQTFKGSELSGLKYQPLFPYFRDTQNAFQTVMADFVTLEEGTGIVHIAPGFGEDDYQLGLTYDVPLIQHVGIDGKFTSDVTDFAGLPVKPKNNPLETDIKIIKYLQASGVLFKKQNIKHSYPHCWRCDTPLINYATDSWFVKVTAFKEALLANNQQINWLPEHIKEGRFGNWLQGAPDWAISRNRYWGTPLPIWISEDGDCICIGSISELEELSKQKVTDLHKHVVDQIVITKDGKQFRRIPEVLDCWFESGAMPYASFHYPFENKDDFEANFPAEFISEGQDQTRGWFYTLHVLATALTYGDQPAIPVDHTTSSFKNCVVTGIVLAEDGKKMSKRLQNYPDPMVVGNKYGIDSLRLYLMSSPVVRADNLNFNEREVDEIRRKVINIIWNVYQFYSLFDDGKRNFTFPDNPTHILDKWLVSTTENLVSQYIQDMDDYDVVSASRKLMTYVNELSTWYVRRSRDRFRQSDTNSQSLRVLRTALYRWSLMMAPFAPFITEILYQNLLDTSKSVHLADMVSPNQSLIDLELESTMTQARKVIEKVHALRKEANLKLRQPLASATITSPFQFSQSILDVIRDEINVKQVVTQPGEAIEVHIDTQLTADLKAEGEAREIVRAIQQQRKLAKTDREVLVEVGLPSWPKQYEDEIKQKAGASSLYQADTFTLKPSK